MDGLSTDQLKNVIRDAIREEFIACGLLASTPAEKAEAQEDFIFLRRWRKSFDVAVNKVVSVTLLAVVSFIGGLIYIGFNFKFGK
jgi:hypothetical protein